MYQNMIWLLIGICFEVVWLGKNILGFVLDYELLLIYSYWCYFINKITSIYGTKSDQIDLYHLMRNYKNI